MTRIDELKFLARKHNLNGNQEQLGKVILELEEIWDDHRAAKAFYTELEAAAGVDRV